MANLSWLLSVDGKWKTGGYWSGGTAPTSLDDVTIAAAGFAYRVSLTTPASAHTLFLNSPDVTFAQDADAPLTLSSTLTVGSGVAILRASNTFGGVFNAGGVIQFSNPAAFGTAEIDNTGFGRIEALTTLALGNKLVQGGAAAIDVANGETLRLTGQFVVGANATVQIGELGGVNDGIVELLASSVSVNSSASLLLNAGILRAGNGNAAIALSEFAGIYINPHAELDIDGQSVEIQWLNVSPSGGVVCSGGAGHLKLDGGFAQGISGPLTVEIDGDVTFFSKSTYTGITTVDPAGIMQLGDGLAKGSISGAIVDNGVIKIYSPAAFTFNNPISGTGSLVISNPASNDKVTINQANTYTGGSDIAFGVVAVGNGAALGAGPVSVEFGELLGTATETFGNFLTLDGVPTLSASHGKTLTIDTKWTLEDNARLTFGSAGHDGTVIAEFESLTQGVQTQFVFAAGTVKAADNELGGMLLAGQQTTIAAGASVDAVGFFLGFTHLSGSGTVTNSGAMHELDIDGGAFDGKITGAAHVVFSGTTILAGNSTYTGGTTVSAAAVLGLGNGGTAGTIKGAIDNEGRLVIDHSNAITLAQDISGAGRLQMLGDGTTTLSGHNSYTGGTTIDGGTLVTARSGAIGTGVLTINNAHLLSSISQTVANSLLLGTGTDTIGAADGKTLTLQGHWQVNHDAQIVFGSASDIGTVIFKASGGGMTSPFSFNIEGGTLKVGNSTSGNILSLSEGVTVAAGATLDINGQSFGLADLHGGGIVRSASAATLDLLGAAYAGQINGHIAVIIDGAVKLSGGGNFDGGAALHAGATLHLANSAHEDVTFAGMDAILKLDNPESFSGTVSGMVHTDTIDLAGIDFGGSTHLSFNGATDIMTVTDGTHTAMLQFQDGYHQSDFGLADDGQGHTHVTTSVTVAPIAGMLDADALI